MRKPLRVIIGVLIAYFTFGLVIGFYEYLNGGPWYTYVNISGERLVLGADAAAVSGYHNESRGIPASVQIIDSIFYPVFYFTRNIYA